MYLRLFIAFACLVLACLPTVLFAQLRLHEIVASNSSLISDEDGDTSDWIELYNEGDEWIDLRGYGLSDNVSRVPLWRFQKGRLGPNSYMLVFASGKDRQIEQRYWHTIVNREIPMRYLIPTSEVSETWVEKGFNDSSWKEGFFGIGYGDDDDATEVPEGTVSVFTRTRFSIDNPTTVSDMKFHIDFDDAYVAYLNGVEIHRQNISGSSPLPYDALANTFTDPRLIFGQTLPGISLKNFKRLLVKGENVLAIQVHNNIGTSSDLSLIPFLSVEYSERPDFETLVAEETQLQQSAGRKAHTNFLLSTTGETILLINPYDAVIDSVTYPVLSTDESYGIIEDENEWAIFLNPTPIAPNIGDNFLTRLSTPQPSYKSGFYNGPIFVSVSALSHSEDVRYTTDGSIPTGSSPRFGQESRIVARTAVWRFRTIRNGALSSEVVTRTFLIGEETSLPVLSIGADPEDLWSDERGIYVIGTNGIPGLGMDRPANWNQDWEIPVHLEFFESSGDLGFSISAGAKIFGGWSRMHPQKSLALFFRGKYGASELNYSLFPETGISTYQSFVLRNSGTDFNYTQFRDGLMTQLLTDTDLEFQAFKPTAVFVNGEYWGVQNIREKVNEHFISSHTGVETENIDILEAQGVVVHGRNDHYRQFLNFIAVNSLSDSLVYEQVGEYIDIENFASYYAAQIYFANTDWPGNNIKFWRDNSKNGKWRWIVYDTDFGFSLFGNNTWHNTLAFAREPNGPGWPNPPWATYVFRKMLENQSFRNTFINALADLMNTSFQAETVLGKIDSIKSIIEVEMPRHYNRWGGSFNQWRNNIVTLENFARYRPTAIRSMLRSGFGLSSPQDIEVSVSLAGGGDVRVNTLIPKKYPFSGAYFPEVNVVLKALPKPGFEFDRWTGDITSNAETIEIEAGMSVMAEFRANSNVSSKLVVHEIMYNPDERVNTGDWVEFYNNSGESMDIGFWQVKDSVDSNVFVFPRGTVVAPYEYLVLARDRFSFEKIYGFKPFAKELPFGLGGRQDQVRLFNNFDQLIDSVAYSDRNPWPLDSDGTGKTIVLKDAFADNSKPQNWASSKARGGNPTMQNDVVIPFGTEMDPAIVRISQNFPNPFRWTTSISIDLSHRSTVDLEVYDMLGRLVYQRKSVVLEEGASTLEWEPGQIASGVYIFRVVAGRFSEIKKMTVLK